MKCNSSPEIEKTGARWAFLLGSSAFRIASLWLSLPSPGHPLRPLLSVHLTLRGRWLSTRGPHRPRGGHHRRWWSQRSASPCAWLHRRISSCTWEASAASDDHSSGKQWKWNSEENPGRKMLKAPNYSGMKWTIGHCKAMFLLSVHVDFNCHDSFRACYPTKGAW